MTTIIVVWAVWFAHEVVPSRYDFSHQHPGIVGRFFAWDGAHYAEIVDRGYTYDPARRSNVAFFPAYPVGAICLRSITGCSIEASLLVVSHACLVGAFFLLNLYAHQRSTSENACDADFALVALGLWPTGMFFRMAYSESVFLLVAIAAMYAMERAARPLWVALLVGLATACRPVGIALLGPLAIYLWQRAGRGSRNDDESRDGFHKAKFLLGAVGYLPLACWGIAGFTVFQYLAFGDALAFSKQHEIWSRQQSVPYLEQVARSLIVQPLWTVYDPSSPGYWACHPDAPKNALLSLPFANPIYFVITVGLVWLGWHKRWLNSREVLLSALLLGIAYFTQGDRNYMLSQGRFAAVVFPAYIVLGHLAVRAPGPVVAVCAAASALLLAAYAAQFAAWYRVT